MSVRHPATDERTVTLPGGLESPRAKLVYLYLSTSTGATLQELQDGLALKKITLYSILRTLRRRELVEESDGRYVLADT